MPTNLKERVYIHNDFGGGLNFAAHRLSPSFFTYFMNMAPPDRYLDDDLERMKRNPPKIVVALDLPNFGSAFGGILDAARPSAYFSPGDVHAIVPPSGQPCQAARPRESRRPERPCSAARRASR